MDMQACKLCQRIPPGLSKEGVGPTDGHIWKRRRGRVDRGKTSEVHCEFPVKGVVLLRHWNCQDSN